MKTTGILIPVFSTRRSGDLGIGDTLGMKLWINWAAKYQVGFLQLLPINENGTDESPYSGISSIALDPIYLALDSPGVPLISEADLTEARTGLGKNLAARLVDYPAVRSAKTSLLEISFSRFQKADNKQLGADFQDFRKENASWLPEYCQFKLLIEINGAQLTWDGWTEDTRTPEVARVHIEDLLKKKPEATRSRLDYFAYVQWLCFRQWADLRAYADSLGVQLMGDIPIGVSFHSADVFFHPGEFHTDWFGGTAPEGFSPDNPFMHEWGQNWGIPLYNWDAMAATGYQWWRDRIAHLTQIFRMYRIDHILGFYRIYGFPWHPRRNHEFLGADHGHAAYLTGGPTPRWFDHPDGSDWEKSQNRANGDTRLRAILDASPDAGVIAEDLGWVPDYVRPHLEELDIAGYRIPHWDSQLDGSPVMGAVFPDNSFTSYSTHDHDPLVSVWENCRKSIIAQKKNPTDQGHWDAQGAANSLRLLCGFSGIPLPENDDYPRYSGAIHLRLIKALLEANSRYALFMVTDLFEIPERINTPGTSGNWRLRLDLSDHEMNERGRILANLIRITGRSKERVHHRKKAKTT